MSGMDVFKSDGFSLRSLTAAINNQPFVPGRIGAMGLYRQFGITTTTAEIEVRDNKLYLIEDRPRGADPKRNEDADRDLIPIKARHLPVSDKLMADEVQNVRAFGTENQLQTIQMKTNEKLATMRQSLEATLEYHRMGGITGTILDADGTKVLYNLYTLFGISKIDPIPFDLQAAEPVSGAVRKKCHFVIRTIEDELGAVPYSYVHGFIGKDFMDDLVSHSETLAAYDRWRDGEMRRESFARRTFAYASILFEEYRGKVGSVDFIPDDEARFFPVGSPGLFDCAYAPADYLETVNTNGLPFYGKQTIDRKGRWVEIDAQSNPVHYCTRPRVLITGKAGSA